VNTFALDIWYDEGDYCTFYTVRKLSESEDIPSETDQFFDKYAIPQSHFEEEAYQLFRLITESIGNKYGAIDDFFDRIENKAQALPPKPKYRINEIKEIGRQFPLRLFCYRITEQIVVLFNGGIKEANSAQESKNLSMKFYEAQRFAQKIQEALTSEMIKISIDHRYLQYFDDNPEIIL
jgi:hypothetical protein